jgi:polysaccharide deacetylase family protein (PEP-CTERM system associated)
MVLCFLEIAVFKTVQKPCINGDKDLDVKKMNILTFDIEDWFHLLDNPDTATNEQWKNFESRIHQNVDRLLDLLQENNYKATFFCLGWVAEKYPEIIRKIDTLGFEVASHSYMHQLVYEQTPTQFRTDLTKSINTLEDITGKKVSSYRAPGFSFIKENPWAFESLIELGIERDSSVFPAKRGHGGYEDFGADKPSLIKCRGGELKEFPINLGKILNKNIVFSGGGYFRLLPYKTIQRLTQKSDYVMAYFHPRDFDAEQPVLDLSFQRRFKSYVGLKKAYSKCDRWLKSNEFIDLETADNMIDWSQVARVSFD